MQEILSSTAREHSKTRMKPTWTCRFWLSARQCLLGGIGVALLTFVLLSLRANLAIAAVFLPSHCCVAVRYGPALFHRSLSPSSLFYASNTSSRSHLVLTGRQTGRCPSCNHLGDLCLDAGKSSAGQGRARPKSTALRDQVTHHSLSILSTKHQRSILIFANQSSGVAGQHRPLVTPQ